MTVSIKSWRYKLCGGMFVKKWRLRAQCNEHWTTIEYKTRAIFRWCYRPKTSKQVNNSHISGMRIFMIWITFQYISYKIMFFLIIWESYFYYQTVRCVNLYRICTSSLMRCSCLTSKISLIYRERSVPKRSVTKRPSSLANHEAKPQASM